MNTNSPVLTNDGIIELYNKYTENLWYFLPQDLITSSLFLTYTSVIFFGLILVFDLKYLLLILIMFINIYFMNCYKYGNCTTVYYSFFLIIILPLLTILTLIFYNKFSNDNNEKKN